MRRTLNASAEFRTTDGFGNGKVSLGPKHYGESWEITTIAVRVPDGVPNWTIEARIYTGTASPGNLLASTYDGIGDSTDTTVTLQCGDIITVEWSNPSGLAGFPTVIASVYGTQVIGEP